MLSRYSLFKKNLKNGQFWYARFYNEETKSYSLSRSTGIKCTGKNQKKKQAQEKAMEMLEELSLTKDIYLVDYVLSFWNENSQYAKMKKLSENKPLSKAYIKLCNEAVKKHIATYKPFKKLLISKLTSGKLEDWKLWALENKAGKEQINTTLKAIRVPIRYLLSRGDIDIKDPFKNVKNVNTTPKEKGILTNEEVQRLLNTEYSDLRIYLAVMLSILTGLRRGELRGLLWEDIDFDNGIINIHNNYIDKEGLKGCKWGSNRQVLLPTPLIPIFNKLQLITPYRADKDFVLFSVDNTRKANNREKPLSINSIRAGFKNFLIKGGISQQEQKERNLTLHGMRHTFVTMARMAGVPDIAVQAMAGHKSAEMMNRYSHGGQVINLQEYKSKLEAM